MDEERQERIRYYSFAAFVGALLLLNVTGVWKSIFGIDTAVIITLLAGYKTFHNSISALLEKRISADIALCVAVIAALSVGEYLAAAEAMFIVLVGEGLESYAAGRTEATYTSLGNAIRYGPLPDIQEPGERGTGRAASSGGSSLRRSGRKAPGFMFHSLLRLGRSRRTRSHSSANRVHRDWPWRDEAWSRRGWESRDCRAPTASSGRPG